ncbi:YggT family protein [Corynebacterium breve]|uniref:YggT family protein n=1 Tax=Corynebacterium breve TaxID=3049799 RepID=A0ABY8VHC2_9CORY|nr:YggT family protein [Corynebacterium breve]WIM69045.1 YggT family protein [Corynebacterium breve]
MLGAILYAIVRIYALIVIVRILIEMVQSFSRQFAPPSWFMVIAEFFFVVTDPPIKALRRIIPPMRMGGVALDLSVLVLFFALSILGAIIRIVF